MIFCCLKDYMIVTSCIHMDIIKSTLDQDVNILATCLCKNELIMNLKKACKSVTTITCNPSITNFI